MEAPDGMGADRYNERQNMAASKQIDEPQYDIIAVDSNGEELYETASAWTEDEAVEETEDHNQSAKLPMETAEGVVVRFEHRPRDERPKQ